MNFECVSEVDEVKRGGGGGEAEGAGSCLPKRGALHCIVSLVSSSFSKGNGVHCVLMGRPGFFKQICRSHVTYNVCVCA